MSERGMMKWAPYKSLDKQGVFLEAMEEKRARIAKPLLSSEEAEEINAILCTYHHRRGFSVHYYQRMAILHEESREKLDEINTIYKFLKIRR
jgi:hypothetical protein